MLALLPFASGSELRVHPEAKRALVECRHALESAVTSHGTPQPGNPRAAREAGRVVQSCSATPASTAVLDGVSCIGLTAEELERFVQLGSAGEVRTAPRRTAPRRAGCGDSAHTVAWRAHGGPTASRPMVRTHKTIAVRVTRGISGLLAETAGASGGISGAPAGSGTGAGGATPPGAGHP